MTISKAKESDKKALMKLWKECFNDDDIYINLWFSTFFNPEATLIAKENSELIGALYVVFYDTVINGNITPSAYICGVGVKKEYRGKKIGSLLMQQANKIIHAHGAKFTFLISEADEFYKSLGYAPYSSTQTCLFDICRVTAPKYSVRENVSLKDFEYVYNEYCNNFDVYIKRSRSEFEFLLNQYSAYNGGIHLIYINNKPCAYIIFDKDDNTIYADEVAYINIDALRSVLNYIYSTGCSRAKLTFASTVPKDFFPQNTRTMQSHCIWTPSANIMHLPNLGFLSIL